MSFGLAFTPRYQRIEKQFLGRHPELRRAYRATLRLLEVDPFHASLRLHPLKGRLAGLHSVSINLSYRITLELMIEDERIVSISVGDYDAVY
ncbi:MAG: plasmid stabilization protein [Chromatiaceae bacterium]